MNHQIRISVIILLDLEALMRAVGVMTLNGMLIKKLQQHAACGTQRQFHRQSTQEDSRWTDGRLIDACPTELGTWSICELGDIHRHGTSRYMYLEM